MIIMVLNVITSAKTLFPSKVTQVQGLGPDGLGLPLFSPYSNNTHLRGFENAITLTKQTFNSYSVNKY